MGIVTKLLRLYVEERILKFLLIICITLLAVNQNCMSHWVLKRMKFKTNVSILIVIEVSCLYTVGEVHARFP